MPSEGQETKGACEIDNRRTEARERGKVMACDIRRRRHRLNHLDLERGYEPLLSCVRICPRTRPTVAGEAVP